MLMSDDETGEHVLLTVRDLMNLEQAGGRLVTLSACETRVVGPQLLDEAVSLPSALLQAGFSGVMASLWSVSDISTAMLMEYLYRSWRVATACPPPRLYAWHNDGYAIPQTARRRTISSTAAPNQLERACPKKWLSAFLPRL